MVRTDFPDDPYLEPDLVRYFPTQLQKRYQPEILGHRLRREIIATQIANQMVNLSGISFDNRMTEDTGAGVVDVMRAWVAARDIFDFPAMWEQIEALPTHVKLDTQLELFLEARRMVERGALWLLRHRRPPLEIASVVAEFQPGITELLDARSRRTCAAGCATRCSPTKRPAWRRVFPSSSRSDRSCGR